MKSFNNEGVQPLSVENTESHRLQPSIAVVYDVPGQSKDTKMLELFTILKSNQYGSSLIENYVETKKMPLQQVFFTTNTIIGRTA